MSSKNKQKSNSYKTLYLVPGNTQGHIQDSIVTGDLQKSQITNIEVNDQGHVSIGRKKEKKEPKKSKRSKKPKRKPPPPPPPPPLTSVPRTFFSPKTHVPESGPPSYKTPSKKRAKPQARKSPTPQKSTTPAYYTVQEPQTINNTHARTSTPTEDAPPLDFTLTEPTEQQREITYQPTRAITYEQENQTIAPTIAYEPQRALTYLQPTTELDEDIIPVLENEERNRLSQLLTRGRNLLHERRPVVPTASFYSNDTTADTHNTTQSTSTRNTTHNSTIPNNSLAWDSYDLNLRHQTDNSLTEPMDISQIVLPQQTIETQTYTPGQQAVETQTITPSRQAVDIQTNILPPQNIIATQTDPPRQKATKFTATQTETRPRHNIETQTFVPRKIITTQTETHPRLSTETQTFIPKTSIKTQTAPKAANTIETQTRAKVAKTTETQTTPKAKPKLSIRPQQSISIRGRPVKPQVKPEVKPEVKPKLEKPEVKQEVKSEVKPKLEKPEVKPKVKPEEKPIKQPAPPPPRKPPSRKPPPPPPRKDSLHLKQPKLEVKSPTPKQKLKQEPKQEPKQESAFPPKQRPTLSASTLKPPPQPIKPPPQPIKKEVIRKPSAKSTQALKEYYRKPASKPEPKSEPATELKTELKSNQKKDFTSTPPRAQQNPLLKLRPTLRLRPKLKLRPIDQLLAPKLKLRPINQLLAQGNVKKPPIRKKVTAIKLSDIELSDDERDAVSPPPITNMYEPVIKYEPRGIKDANVKYDPPPVDVKYEPPPTNVKYEPPFTDVKYEPPPTDVKYEPPPANVKYEPPSTDVKYEPVTGYVPIKKKPLPMKKKKIKPVDQHMTDESDGDDRPKKRKIIAHTHGPKKLKLELTSRPNKRKIVPVRKGAKKIKLELE